jgi:hypothetical protein
MSDNLQYSLLENNMVITITKVSKGVVYSW